VSLVDELLKRISTKGEVGVASLGFVLGYLLDLRVHVSGLAPGIAGVLGLTAAFGLKNTGESLRAFLADRQAPSKASEAANALEKRVGEVLKLSAEAATVSPYITRLADRVRSDSDLWRRGLISEDVLRRTVDAFVEGYRAFGSSGTGQTTDEHGLRVVNQPSPTDV
jgi:hypothetical protein